jgi:hypothetical protein
MRSLPGQDLSSFTGKGDWPPVWVRFARRSQAGHGGSCHPRRACLWQWRSRVARRHSGRTPAEAAGPRPDFLEADARRPRGGLDSRVAARHRGSNAGRGACLCGQLANGSTESGTVTLRMLGTSKRRPCWSADHGARSYPQSSGATLWFGWHGILAATPAESPVCVAGCQLVQWNQ